MDGLKIKEGLTDSQIDQLVSYSNVDETVKRLTTDPRRFQTREMANKWFDEVKPIIYALVDKQQNLMGIVWFHTYPIPETKYIKNINKDEYQITFGIRLYGDARGKGLSVKFFKDCLNRFKKTSFYNSLPHRGFWLGTHPENLPAINLYKKLGFIQINTNPEESNRVYMILDEKN